METKTDRVSRFHPRLHANQDVQADLIMGRTGDCYNDLVEDPYATTGWGCARGLIGPG